MYPTLYLDSGLCSGASVRASKGQMPLINTGYCPPLEGALVPDLTLSQADYGVHRLVFLSGCMVSFNLWDLVFGKLNISFSSSTDPVYMHNALYFAL